MSERYIDSDGKCPCCGEEKVYFGSLSYEDGAWIQDVWCACGCEWHDVYTYSSSVVTREGDSKAKITPVPPEPYSEGSERI